MMLIASAATPIDISVCTGTRTPYPIPTSSYDYPDSLKPVYINHIGRHGARFPTSNSSARLLMSYIDKAEKNGSITEIGIKFKALLENILSNIDNRWEIGRAHV